MRHTVRYGDFYPRPPRGGRPNGLVAFANGYIFLSTPSARRATWLPERAAGERSDFYPRPPRGGRLMQLANLARAGQFLSTPSARRATFTQDKIATLTAEFLSTPSARRATPHGAHRGMVILFLSTPSARRATQEAPVKFSTQKISIHALREEGDVTSAAG